MLQAAGVVLRIGRGGRGTAQKRPESTLFAVWRECPSSAKVSSTAGSSESHCAADHRGKAASAKHRSSKARAAAYNVRVRARTRPAAKGVSSGKRGSHGTAVVEVTGAEAASLGARYGPERLRGKRSTGAAELEARASRGAARRVPWGSCNVGGAGVAA